MQAMKLMLALLFVVEVSWGQGATILFYELDQILTDSCGGGNPLPDGTEVCIYWDVDLDGPDFADPLFPICEWIPPIPPCSTWHANYNCFQMNGEVEIGQAGQFFTTSAFVTLGIPIPPRLYLRICLPEIRWESSVFTIIVGAMDIDVSQWNCISSPCEVPPPPPPQELTITFAGCMQRMGCPCENATQFPEGTQVRLMYWYDDPAGPSFTYSRGSGLPPWDCNWTPIPGGRPPSDRYYILIESEACCWYSDVFTVSDSTNEVTLRLTDWGCSNQCERWDLLVPPRNLTAECHGTRVSLAWSGTGIEELFEIYDGDFEFVASVPGDVFTFEIAIRPGINRFYIVSWNEYGVSEAAEVEVECPAGIVQAELPHRDRLGPDGIRISPNPFNPTTRIEFELTEQQRVTLNIFDIQGRVVESLLNQQLESGMHTQVWDASHLPSGIYFAKLVTRANIRVEKLLLMK